MRIELASCVWCFRGTGTGIGTDRYMYIKYIGTGIGRGNSVMKGITENRPCGAFRPAGNGESLPGGILPLKKRELRGPPGTIYGIRRGNISSDLRSDISRDFNQ